MLNFEINDADESEEEAGGRPARVIANVAAKKEAVSCVAVHAIPVYDGVQISSETDIMDSLIDIGEMNVELINDFEIPWVLRKYA